ncbi:hypothetical protein [Bacillus sp. FJAT-28004]|uniref:hypothetical protein n=1 Tax=Bacillus sp. FJAT-28004 TaxID=1679165 RepID=UPI000A7988FE|nr:hypothetical protein [Bacillus sp. FJAT-28004]
MFLLVSISTACSPKKTPTLEEQFKKIMVENNITFDSVWHFEVKDNVVIIFYEKEQTLNVGFIKNNQSKWEWITGSGSIDLQEGGYIATAEMRLPFYITAVVKPNENVQGISVQGEYAKLVQINPKDKVWFAFTNRPANGNDIKEIK